MIANNSRFNPGGILPQREFTNSLYDLASVVLPDLEPFFKLMYRVALWPQLHHVAPQVVAWLTELAAFLLGCHADDCR